MSARNGAVKLLRLRTRLQPREGRRAFDEGRRAFEMIPLILRAGPIRAYLCPALPAAP
jgi:hypothetical protein